MQQTLDPNTHRPCIQSCHDLRQTPVWVYQPAHCELQPRLNRKYYQPVLVRTCQPAELQRETPICGIQNMNLVSDTQIQVSCSNSFVKIIQTENIHHLCLANLSSNNVTKMHLQIQKMKHVAERLPKMPQQKVHVVVISFVISF